MEPCYVYRIFTDYSDIQAWANKLARAQTRMIRVYNSGGVGVTSNLYIWFSTDLRAEYPSTPFSVLLTELFGIMFKQQRIWLTRVSWLELFWNPGIEVTCIHPEYMHIFSSSRLLLKRQKLKAINE